MKFGIYQKLLSQSFMLIALNCVNRDMRGQLKSQFAIVNWYQFKLS